MVDNIAVVDRGVPAPPPGQSSATFSRPRIANSNIFTTDITTQFWYAASRLHAGTLVKDESFTLFESVGALEIGDPKMDSGCQADDDPFVPEFDVLKPLQPSEILWLMDELMSREVAWQTGYPLSQTLFTSYHVDSMLWPSPTGISEAHFGRGSINRHDDPLLHTFFRSYCLGLIKTCDLVLDNVTAQHYYEEEDFATQLFNRELHRRISIDDILATMHQGLTWLQSAVIDPEIRPHLRVRLEFRVAVLKGLSKHSSLECENEAMAISYLDAIKSSTRYGMPISEAFSPKIQTRLASTVPPRPMITLKIEKTLDFWSQSCRNMFHAFDVISVTHAEDLYTSYSLFNSQEVQPSLYVRALLQSFLGQSWTVLGRYNTSDFILQDACTLTLPSSPLMGFCDGSQETHDSITMEVQTQLRAFLSRIERSYLNVLCTLCLNRSRMRRTLCHAAVEWDQIQGEAEDIDDHFHGVVGEKSQAYPVGANPTFSYPISSWIYHHKLVQIRLIIQMGFELSIYAPHELSGLYWYLAHICDTHLAHLERISFFVSHREASLTVTDPRALSDNTSVQQCQETLRILFRHFAFLKATEALARALHAVYTVLERHGHVQPPRPTYSSDALRYEIRMKPFAFLSVPEPLSFAQFQHLSSLEGQTDEEILTRAASFTNIAKKGWDEILKTAWHAFPLQSQGEGSGRPTDVLSDLWMQEHRAVVKASIATGIVVSSLQKRLQGHDQNQDGRSKEGGLKPVDGFTVQLPTKGDRDCWHRFWLVPRITTDAGERQQSQGRVGGQAK